MMTFTERKLTIITFYWSIASIKAKVCIFLEKKYATYVHYSLKKKKTIVSPFNSDKLGFNHTYERTKYF